MDLRWSEQVFQIFLDSINGAKKLLMVELVDVKDQILLRNRRASENDKAKKSRGMSSVKSKD